MRTAIRKKITFSPLFEKKLKETKSKNVRLYKKILQQLKLFSQNPEHNSLRVHKLQGNLKNTWSISVSKDFRLVFVEDGSYYFFNLGTHDEVYKK